MVKKVKNTEPEVASEEVMVVDYTPTKENDKKSTVEILKEDIGAIEEIDEDDLMDDDLLIETLTEHLDKSSSQSQQDDDNNEPDIEQVVDSSILEAEFNIPIKCFPVRLEDIVKKRKVQRTNFFYEINEVEERINKKKYSETKAPEYPTRCKRSKEHKQEESPEELVARIARELDEDRSLNFKQGITQWCTKCGSLPVNDAYRIDRNLGYCEECADILKLGESKEARGLFSADEDDEDDQGI